MSVSRANHYPDLAAAIEGTQAPDEMIGQLALVEIDFLNFDLEHAIGQLVVASEFAGEVQEIFGDIRDARFPIRSIIPIAYFGHEDDRSVAADNTSAFNYRVVYGTERLSKHSYGKAIDINPLLNPYVKLDGSPMPGNFTSTVYNLSVPGTIGPGSEVVEAFTSRGWDWGGNWGDEVDYQHFDKFDR